MKAATVAGPMSRPISPSGTPSAGTISVGASASIAGAATTSTGRCTGTPRDRAAASASRTSSSLSSSTSERADLAALRGDERERHRAPDHERVDALGQRSDHPELVAHLGSAEDRHERLRGVVQQRAEHLDLARDQTTGDGRAAGGEHQLRERRDGGVRTVDRPEGVVDVGVGVLGEEAGERDVVRLLPRVEPEVLQQDHVVVGKRPRGSPRRARSPAVRGAPRALGRPGASRRPSTTCPLGLPRWDAITRRAPRSRSSRAVGTVAAIRASSVMAPSRSGTFRSARRNTRAPATSPSASRVRIVTG